MKKRTIAGGGWVNRERGIEFKSQRAQEATIDADWLNNFYPPRAEEREPLAEERYC